MKTFKLLLTFVLLTQICVGQTRFKSLNYLYSIRGTKAIGGMHNRQPNSNPNSYSQQLNGITGNWPGLYSADFQFESNEIANRQTMINQVIAEWNNGAMINIMWHACNPAKGEPCNWDSNGVLSKMTNAEWTQLLTNGTAINNAWKSRMDAIAVFLQQLENAGVEVFFRPLHEMNQGMFWWAGRPGANGTAALYRMTHNYLTNTKGLSNLIWVWNLQDFGSLSSDLNNYDPGSSYWDVLTMDMYWTDGQGYTTAKYNALVNKANGKPIGIGECQDLPAVNLLNSQPLWTFFMGWSELTFQHNTTAKIQEIYWSSKVITLNEMPKWNTIPIPPSGGGIQYIQAESYANMSGVQTETTSDASGGLNVGWIDANDWMTYNSINIPSNGNYTIGYRVASASGGGSLRLEAAGGGTIYGTVNIPSTGGWQTWTTVYQTIYLTAGVKNFGIKAMTAGWNFNWWSIAPATGGRMIEEDLGTELTKVTAYPNPFQSEVTIPVHTEGAFKLTIYDFSGKQIRVFTERDRMGETSEIIWNGKNQDNSELSNGLYHFQLISPNGTQVGKVIKKA